MLKVPEFHPPLRGIVGEEVSLEYPKFQTAYGVADAEIHYLEHEREQLKTKAEVEYDLYHFAPDMMFFDPDDDSAAQLQEQKEFLKKQIKYLKNVDLEEEHKITISKGNPQGLAVEELGDFRDVELGDAKSQLKQIRQEIKKRKKEFEEEQLKRKKEELRSKEDYKRIGTTISLEDQKLIDKLEESRWEKDEREWEDYTKSELLPILKNKEELLKMINKYGLLKYEEYVRKESYENDPEMKEMVEDDNSGEFDFLKRDIEDIKRILENKEYMFDPDDTDEEEYDFEPEVTIEEEDLKKLVEMGYITGVEEGEELELHKGFKMESEDEVEEYVKKYPKFKKDLESKIERFRAGKAKEEKAKEEKEKAKMPTKEELKEEKKKIRYEKVGEWSLEELEQYNKYKQQVKKLNKEEILARYNKYIKNRKLGLGMAIDWLTNNMKKYREGAPPFYAGGKKRGNILLGILKEIENPL